MKRAMNVILTMVFVSFMSGLAFSEDAQSPMPGCMGMQGKMMQEEGKPGMDPMHMMKKMMNATMVATKDGGVIVLAGNKLLKYDKDLNLVKKVEIKMDMGALPKMMDTMKPEGCGCRNK